MNNCKYVWGFKICSQRLDCPAHPFWLGVRFILINSEICTVVYRISSRFLELFVLLKRVWGKSANGLPYFTLNDRSFHISHGDLHSNVYLSHQLGAGLSGDYLLTFKYLYNFPLHFQKGKKSFTLPHILKCSLFGVFFCYGALVLACCLFIITIHSQSHCGFCCCIWLQCYWEHNRKLE